MQRILTFILITLLGTVCSANAQQIPNAMPSSSIKQQVGISELTVSYRRPNVQKRQIRTGKDAVVPDHKIWNTSIALVSNTEFSIANTALSAGRYTLSAIPHRLNWTLIFKKVNEETDDQEEVLKISVEQESIPFTETLEVRLSNITDSAAVLSLLWDTFSIPIHISVPTNALVLKSYQDALFHQLAGHVGHDEHAAHGNTLQYGSWFLMTRNFELPLALEWIEKDIAYQETYFNTWLKAQVLRRLKRNEEALETAQKALDLALVSSDFDFGTYVPRIRNALKFWRKTLGSSELVEVVN